MKRPRIVDAMEHIDEELITEAVSYKPKRKRIPTVFKWIAAAACFSLIISTFTVIPALLNDNKEIPTFPNENTHPSHSFNGFVLTAYAANSEDYRLTENVIADAHTVVMQPHVEILLGKYTPLTSSVPGFPFKFDAEDNYEIEVSVENGTLCRWDRNTGVVTNCGKSTAYIKGEILYWGPMSDNGNIEKNSTITVAALYNGDIVGKQEISITANDSFFYSACVDDLKPS